MASRNPFSGHPLQWTYIPSTSPSASRQMLWVHGAQNPSERINAAHQAPVPRHSIPTPHPYSLSPPRLPRGRCIPLPPAPPAPSPASTFPLDITTDLYPHAVAALRATPIPPPTIVHIHDPTSHIGDIHIQQGPHSALHVIQYVQGISRGPVHPSAYQRLSGEMQQRVMGAYRSRVAVIAMPVVPAPERVRRTERPQVGWGAPPHGDGRGLGRPAGPSGEDLLLGNIYVWGLDFDPRSGEWVLHVSNPRTTSAWNH